MEEGLVITIVMNNELLTCIAMFNIIHIIYPVMSSMRDITELLDESLKMKSFSHPNVLNLIGVCVDAGPAPYVVMPYMANGSLLHYLRKERPHLTIAEEVEPELVSPVLRPSKTSRTTSAPPQSQITPSFIPSQHPLPRLRAVQGLACYECRRLVLSLLFNMYTTMML